MRKKQGSILGILTLLTALFIFTQLLFLGIDCYIHNFGRILERVLQYKLHFPGIELSSFIQFFFSQVLIYALDIYLLWYTLTAVEKLFSLAGPYTQALTIFLWFVSLITILAANTYYVSHSFFSILLRHNLFHDSLSDARLKFILILTASIWLAATALAFFSLCRDLYRRQALVRAYTALMLIASLFVLTYSTYFFEKKQLVSTATEEKPNIFIIGFDALRPDYLSFFDKRHTSTPQFDTFLKSSIVFTDAYTPLARTFPSWVSILSAQHPLHTQAREDMFNLKSIKLNKTLPQILKEAGYETIYASDDNRFNNINNSLFGFDSFIGPPGNATDFIISALNDFPLSNLLIPTTLGKLLFPYNHANHAATQTYKPENFLDLLNEALEQRGTKPLFLAAHFNITGWPFYWFNDHQSYSVASLNLYKNALVRADQQLADFLKILDQKGLLKHAIFVLISDHGITLQMPNDRLVSEQLYQGNKNNINLKRTQYNIRLVSDKKDLASGQGEEKNIYVGELSSAAELDKIQSKILAPSNPALYGIDTSWGYGNDVLSLKQYRPLLAFRAYGIHLGAPHQSSVRSLLLDIAPTLLAILGLPPMQESEGRSLKPYLLDPHLKASLERPIFLESCYSFEEIEKDHPIVSQVLEKSLSLFQVDPENDLVSMTPLGAKWIIETKQRAVLKGNWLLAYYPASRRYKIAQSLHDKEKRLETYILPPYTVLVNLKSGKWTTNLSDSFATTAPIAALSKQLHDFYGREMDNYLPL